MRSATITTANTVNPSTDNSHQPQQKQTAKEVIAANVQALIEQLEQGHSEGLGDGLCIFHKRLDSGR
jgi:hypothetical protein